jgi:hypothetical protein
MYSAVIERLSRALDITLDNCFIAHTFGQECETVNNPMGGTSGIMSGNSKNRISNFFLEKKKQQKCISG